MNEVLDNLPTKLPRLRHIAEKCEAKAGKQYGSIPALRLDIERRSSGQIYLFISIFIMLMSCLLVWLALR